MSMRFPCSSGKGDVDVHRFRDERVKSYKAVYERVNTRLAARSGAPAQRITDHRGYTVRAE